MKSQRVFWNEIFKKTKSLPPPKDNWLEKYLPIIKSCIDVVVDLGCGKGADSIFLYGNGVNAIACDFSEEALKKNRKFKISISPHDVLI